MQSASPLYLLTIIEKPPFCNFSTYFCKFAHPPNPGRLSLVSLVTLLPPDALVIFQCFSLFSMLIASISVLCLAPSAPFSTPQFENIPKVTAMNFGTRFPSLRRIEPQHLPKYPKFWNFQLFFGGAKLVTGDVFWVFWTIITFLAWAAPLFQPLTRFFRLFAPPKLPNYVKSAFPSWLLKFGL